MLSLTHPAFSWGHFITFSLIPLAFSYFSLKEFIFVVKSWGHMSHLDLVMQFPLTEWNFSRGLRTWLALRKTRKWASMSLWLRHPIEIVLETLVKTGSRHITGIFFPQMWLKQELNQTSCFLLSGTLRAEWKLFQRNSQWQNFTLGTVSLSRLQLLK